MLILMGHLHLEPADVDAFIADVRASAVITRGEPGCLFYSMTVDDALAGSIALAQRWQDQAALDRHVKAPNTALFLQKWRARFTADFQQYDVVNP